MDGYGEELICIWKRINDDAWFTQKENETAKRQQLAAFWCLSPGLCRVVLGLFWLKATWHEWQWEASVSFWGFDLVLICDTLHKSNEGLLEFGSNVLGP
jgi:hypothetical protein